MPELDFGALRSQVEAATRLPDFSEVGRRAGRARLRDRMATAGALLATVLVFMPVILVAMRARPATDAVLGVNPPDELVVDATPSLAVSELDRPMTIAVRAVGGSDFDHLYTVVDVCNGPTAKRRCMLQVSELSGTRSPGLGPIHTGALRQAATDPLTDVRLVSLSETSLLIGGAPADGPRTYMRIEVDGTSSPVAPPTDAVPLGPGDRLVQLRDHGELYGIRSTDGRLGRLPTQPPLAQAAPVQSIAPEFGWWVTGHDPASGSLAVAVSRDQAATWTTRRLEVPSGLDTPTLATYDGVTVYAFVRGTDGIRQLGSTDGGQSWTEIKTRIPWPAPLAGAGALAGRAFGAVVRSGGSLLLWIDDDTAPVFVESTDGGRNYRAVSGPPGRVVTVPGGYVALSNPPALSRDAQTWIHAARAPIVPVN